MKKHSRVGVATILIDVGGIDWKLLKDQKIALQQIIELTGNKKRIDLFEGLLALLDNIQDQAAEQLGEKKVFGIL